MRTHARQHCSTVTVTVALENHIPTLIELPRRQLIPGHNDPNVRNCSTHFSSSNFVLFAAGFAQRPSATNQRLADRISYSKILALRLKRTVKPVSLMACKACLVAPAQT
jgi:hypothetical protein